MSQPQISMNDLHKILSQLGSNDLILDVRSVEEYQSGHVPGSKNISYDQVKSHIEELKKFKTIYVYCQAGRRAAIATDELQKLGLRNIVCIGETGMGDWIAAGFPLEK